LALKPPEDPLAAYSRALQVRSAMQNQQLQQGQIQLQQQQIRDQQALTAAAAEWDGKDYDALAKSVLKNGGSANASFAVQQHALGVKKTVSDIAASDATTGEKNLQTFIGKHKAIGDALAGVDKVPDDQLHDFAAGTVDDLTKGGILDPQTGAKFAQGIQSTQDPKALRDEITVFAKTSMGAKAAAEQAEAANKARLTGAQAGIEENKLRMIQNANPADYANLVDQVIPPTGGNSALNHRTKTLVNFAISRGDLEGAQKALTEATNQVSAIEKETNPQVIAAKVGTAVATEVAKAKALAPPLQTITRTTISGGKYISAEDAAGESGNYIRQQAAQQGIPVLSKDTSETLSDIDTARANQNYMLGVIGKKLASDPTGRLYTAPGNTLQKLAQTDPDMAAVGTFRNAAIQSMRAVAGAKGLRINQYEVQLAIDNDIPKLTDTLPTAQAKLRNLQNFLANAEQSHLLHNRTQMQNAPAPGQPGGQPAAQHPFFKQFGGAAIGETNPQ
jgi:hypothetical protein